MQQSLCVSVFVPMGRCGGGWELHWDHWDCSSVFLEFTYCRTIEDIGKSTALDFNQKVGPRMLYYHVHISRTLPTPARRPAGRVGAHNELN